MTDTRCSSGFYRERAGPYRGQCVPCSCNGLSNECDERTGNCVNCQFDSTGDRCERCKEGYYGNAAERTCRACPCPFTRNNFALACLDIGSGVVECLCKRGYSGARCERCAFGYYGNPVVYGGSCKPCNCKDSSNICDSLTGECITSGNSSCGAHCHECDSCTMSLLLDLERMDDVLAQQKQQLQNVSDGAGSIFRLNDLQANISETKIRVWRYSTAVRHLDPKVEQLEADVDAVRDDLSQLTDQTLESVSDLEEVLQNASETKLKAEDLLSEAETLLTAIQDLIKQQTEVKPGESATLSQSDRARMMEEAQRVVQEMRERGCAAQRGRAGREQEDAHHLLDIIRNMTDPVETNQAVLNQTADSLMASDSALREVAVLLSDTKDRVNRTQSLNLKSGATLQHLEHLQSQLEGEQSALLPVTGMTRDLLKNTTDVFLMLEEIKSEFENHAAQLDGAKLELLKKLNNIVQIKTKVDIVSKAEEHAEKLNREAAEFQQVLHNSTNSTDLHSVLSVGAYNNIIKAIEEAEMAANQSREAVDQASKDVKEGGLVNRAEGLKDNSTHLQTEANETQRKLETLSHTVNTLKDRVNTQKEKGESLRTDISTVTDNLNKIKRDDTDVLIKSAKTAASASNSTVNDITERVRNLSQDVERIPLTNVSVNIDDTLAEAEQALKNLSTAVPVLEDKITQVEALSEKASPGANMTESIRRIKDVIEETRNFVDRLSVATTFYGKGHVELRPPRNLDDIKAFTAVDLLLNRHQNNPSKANYRRKRRQNKHRDANMFVFYLGNKDASGDYIGMAISSNVLTCVYKLGGVVHEIVTSPITTTTNVNSSDFDRVIFHRVYQDAEVNITGNFTSQNPIHRSPKRNHPNTMTGVLELDPVSVVFYVGGYPKNFMPPVQLRYPQYRGAMKLSYINNNPVSLFNYKRAVNMDAKQPPIKIPHSEVSDYYDGTGYRMAIIREPHKMKRRLFRFHTNSRETNAVLFFIGNEGSFFCVFVERGFLVLQGQQAGRELRVQSADKVSLFDKPFAITIADRFIVHCGPQQISTEHNQTNYMSFYIGGVPAQLRQRHNITAPALRGCVDHLTVDTEIAEYFRTIGVSNRCPVSLLGVRSATLYSALSVDSSALWGEQTAGVSLGFRSTDRDGPLLRSSSQGSTSVHNFKLSLDDGYVVFKSDDYTLRSDDRYSDGSWHYLSAVRRPTGLELRIDNVKVIRGQSPGLRLEDQNSQGGKFKSCIANLYIRRGFLVLQGQQAGRELRVQSADKVSLFDKPFAITIADRFIVHCGPQQISTEHNQTNYMSFYIGGVPAQLRQRHNITAPALRGCVDHLTVDTEIAEYIRTIGVSNRCPVSLLGVRSATLYSALSVDSSALWGEQTAGVSLGFRSTDRDGPLLRSSSQGSTSVHNFKLSLDDGYVVFKSDDYTLRSDDRYSDGSWHYLSAVRRPTGLELRIDNVKVIRGQSPGLRLEDQNSQGGKFKSCIANLYIRRPEQSFIPADLSSFPQTGVAVLGLCSLHQAPHTKLLQDPVLRRSQKHKPIQVPTGSQCKHRRAHHEYQLTEEHSWLSYTVPQQDLNHRPHFSLDIKTKSSKGLILHVAGRGVVPLLALYMANGKIKMSLGQNRIILHKQQSNDGNWHRVELSVERSTFHLLVDGNRVTDGDLPNNEGSSLNLHNPVYLGGDPRSKITKGHNIPTNSVIGCIRDFRMNDVVIGEPEESHKTLPCMDGLTEMGTYLGGGHIILDNYFSFGSPFALAFELRPQYLTGLLFHVQSHKASFNVFLMENKVGVEVHDGEEAVSVSITPPESLCDGKFHMVTVSKQRDVIELAVDSMSEQRYIPFISTSTTLETLYIGGTTKQTRVSVFSPFVGCLRNVKFYGRPVALETGSRVVGPVSINTCPAE
uniref:laminin subunit alpha-3 n=2 Tax=Epinephelus lanceolatus TaxID=310571 RepID=UPI001444DD67|nr:laminin subunit alpha-3 [Epinephelus lanceolatus]